MNRLGGFIWYQMSRHLIKGFQALKTVFKDGDMVRHIYKNSVETGIIDKEGYLVSDYLSLPCQHSPLITSARL